MALSLKRADLLVAILCVASVFAFLGSREIDGVRERRLAGTAADVDLHGHWLLPHLRGQPRFFKPPYADWLAVTSMRLVGRDEFGFRFPFALAGLGMIAVAWALGRRLVNDDAGRLAALILASSVWFVSECHSASQDLYLGCFAGAALLSWWRWQEAARPWSAGWWSFWLCVTAACLIKGPVALAIIGIPIALELWQARRASLALTMRPWWGLLLVVAVAAAWPLAVWMQVPDFPQRLAADMKLSLVRDEADAKWSYFNHLVNWPWMTFPWTLLGVGALALPLLRRAVPEWPRLRFAWLWLIGNYVFFCAWGMQPKHYLLPVMPALAVIEAALCLRLVEALRATEAGWLIRGAVVVLTLTSVGLAIGAAGMLHSRGGVDIGRAAALGAMVALPAMVALIWLRSRPERWLALLVAAGLLGTGVYSGGVWPALSRQQTLAPFGRALAARVPAGEPVWFTETKDSLPFHARRDFRPLDLKGSPDFAAALEKPRTGWLLMARWHHDAAAKTVGGRVRLEIVAEQNAVPKARSDDLLLVRFVTRGQ
ncbi:MAG: glycosyltransferase family 39 protein [Verrucomicrobia bacterium]|nr:glycosyltransferase family 39 protein [Verrucomicrobiota bacterium]